METITSVLLSPVTWVIVLVHSLLYLFYRLGTANHTYFSDQGIPGPRPRWFVGNMWGIWKQNLPRLDRELVKKYGRVFGMLDGTQPVLWITDADMIRTIFVKEFDHFVNRRNFNVSAKTFRKMMTLIKDQEWKDVRSSVTPTFTTGKIKMMSEMIKQCSNRLTEKFDKIAEDEGKMVAKDQFGAFTMDVIARCAFGMTIPNLGEENDPFIKNAKKVFSPPANKSPLILAVFLLPNLLSYFTEKLFQTKEFTFFVNILEDLIKQRRNTSEKYHDFVEMATESISEYRKEVDGKSVPMWDREEVDEIVIAQSTLFMVAGYDTTATTLTTTIFQLVKNPDVQEKLYLEILNKIEQFGEVNHNMVLDFPYLDHIIHEALRMYPPALRVERECNKDTVVNGIHIKKGVIVNVPAFGLHYDEGYYPDPEKFDPDRWSSENKANINPYAWMPFGMGPRNCVGMRFALEEMKIALCTLIHRFEFFPVAETPDELEFDDGFIGVVQPIHSTVGIKRRQ